MLILKPLSHQLNRPSNKFSVLTYNAGHFLGRYTKRFPRNPEERAFLKISRFYQVGTSLNEVSSLNVSLETVKKCLPS